jgi:hypothetical protein
MASAPPSTFEWSILLFLCLLAALFLHQAWAHLAKRTVSRYSADGLAVLMVNKLAKKNIRERVRQTLMNPSRLTFLGLSALAGAVAAIIEAANWAGEMLR